MAGGKEAARAGVNAYAVTLAGPALDWLAACRDAKLKGRVSDVIDRLSDHPRPPGCVKLAGESNAWRVRVGE